MPACENFRSKIDRDGHHVVPLTFSSTPAFIFRQRGWAPPPQPLLLGKLASPEGQEVVLCDFASAGAAGTVYVSWFPTRGATLQSLTRANPSRTRSVS
jgi:hypothetical protein